MTNIYVQGAGCVEAGGRDAAVSGGRGQLERGGPQPAAGPAGARHPAGEQTHSHPAAGQWLNIFIGCQKYFSH